MANKKISQLTAKGTALAATDLVEISEDSGGGTYVTKSVTGANIKSGLQPTLVSGTNIKTVNSTTLLGSGNLAVQDTLVSGTNIKTINSTTLLGSGDLTLPIGVHILTKPVSGRTYNARTTSAGGGFVGSLSGSSIQLYPFIPANSLTVSSFAVSVSTLTVGGLLRILIYSDSNGVPTTRLLESINQDCSTTGVRTYTGSFTFNAGTVYWLGYYANMNLNNMSVFSPAELTPISAPTSSFSNAHRIVTATATFGSAPTTLGTATPATSDALYINLISA
jgi:hypothetical protein